MNRLPPEIYGEVRGCLFLLVFISDTHTHTIWQWHIKFITASSLRWRGSPWSFYKSWVEGILMIHGRYPYVQGLPRVRAPFEAAISHMHPACMGRILYYVELQWYTLGVVPLPVTVCTWVLYTKRSVVGDTRLSKECHLVQKCHLVWSSFCFIYNSRVIVLSIVFRPGLLLFRQDKRDNLPP